MTATDPAKPELPQGETGRHVLFHLRFDQQGKPEIILGKPLAWLLVSLLGGSTAGAVALHLLSK